MMTNFDAQPMAPMRAKITEKTVLVGVGDPFRFIAYRSPFFYKTNRKGSPTPTKKNTRDALPPMAGNQLSKIQGMKPPVSMSTGKRK